MRGDVEYVSAGSLDEAQELLWRHGKEATVLAGGTDVMVDMREGKLKTRFLLDISGIPNLKGIALTGEGLSIGAGVTLTEIQESEIVARHAPSLKKASLTFASRQIRNVATIGGNVAHCSPCGDTIPPLLIHEAMAETASRYGRRMLPVEELASGPYRCALHPEEIIVRFLLKTVRGGFSEFQKIGRRKELAIARISLAAMVESDSEGRTSFIRLALGSCTPTPRRMVELEEYLTGKIPDAGLLWEAGGRIAGRMMEISGRRASFQYKEDAVQGLFFRMCQPLLNHE